MNQGVGAVAVVAAVVACGMSGCSFMAVQGPKLEGINCTTEQIAPALDTVAAIGGGVAAAKIFAQYEPADPDSGDGTPDPAGLLVAMVGVPLALLAATYVGSAVYGFYEVGECKQYLDEKPDRDHAAMLKAQADENQRERELERERLARERFVLSPAGEAQAEKERLRKESLDQAFALLKTATQAARSGDCATAIALGEQIHVKNSNVLYGWYLRDVDIRRCLDAARPVAPAAPSDAGVVSLSPDAAP